MARPVRRRASGPRLQRLPRRPGEAHRRVVSTGSWPCAIRLGFFIAIRSLCVYRGLRFVVTVRFLATPVRGDFRTGLRELPRGAAAGAGAAASRRSAARREACSLRSSVVSVSTSSSSWLARRSACSRRAFSSLSRIDSTWERTSRSWRSRARALLRGLPCSAGGALAGLVERLQPEALGGVQHRFREAVQGGGSGVEAAGEAAPPGVEQRVDGVRGAAADRRADLLDRGALAVAQQLVGGAVDVGGGDAAGGDAADGCGGDSVMAGGVGCEACSRNIHTTYGVLNKTTYGFRRVGTTPAWGGRPRVRVGRGASARSGGLYSCDVIGCDQGPGVGRCGVDCQGGGSRMRRAVRFVGLTTRPRCC